MAVAPGAEANWSHYVDQNFLFQFSLKIIDKKQRRMLSDLWKQNFFSIEPSFCTILDMAKIQLFWHIFVIYLTKSSLFMP